MEVDDFLARDLVTVALVRNVPKKERGEDEVSGKNARIVVKVGVYNEKYNAHEEGKAHGFDPE